LFVFQAAINTESIPPELILSTSNADDVFGLLDLLRRAAAISETGKCLCTPRSCPNGELAIALQRSDHPPTIRLTIKER